MAQGVEIWGWEVKKELEKVFMDYLRQVLKLDFYTPRYLITREPGLYQLKINWGLRAITFEKRIRDMSDKRLVKNCWQALKEEGWSTLYGIERTKYFNRNDLGLMEVERLMNENCDINKKIKRTERDIQRQIKESRIDESKYKQVESH